MYKLRVPENYDVGSIAREHVALSFQPRAIGAAAGQLHVHQALRALEFAISHMQLHGHATLKSCERIPKDLVLTRSANG